MKQIILCLVFLTAIFTGNAQSSFHELTDLKAIPFASKLRTWQNQLIDSLRMDIYYPTGAQSNKKYPMVLFCHAGGFTGGSRFNVSDICDKLADKGFIAVALDYRTGYNANKDSSVCYRDSLTLNLAIYRAAQDVNACLRFLSAHAEEYYIDTSWMFIGGSSAGAALVLYDAYLNDSTAQIFFPYALSSLGSLDSSGNTLPAHYTVKGICSMWGALFNDQIISPDYKAIPTILFKGEEDPCIPDSVGHYCTCPTLPVIAGGYAVYSRLRYFNVPGVYHGMSGAGHAAYDDNFAVENTACFFKAIIEGKPYSGLFTYFDPSCPQ